MGGVNRVHLVGNLGKDPDLRETGSGMAVCNIRLAIGERKKDGDTWKDHTEWVDVVVFGKQAENCAQYLAKGRQAYFEGRLQTRKWQDKEGNDRWSTEVVANNVVFLGSKDDAPVRSEPPAAKGSNGFVDGNESLPF